MTYHPGYEKNQPRITGMDNQILSLYAKGMTTREIATAFKEMYDTNVSGTDTKVTGTVMEQFVEWQNRPLDAVYPHCLSCLYCPESSAGQSLSSDKPKQVG